MNFVSCSQEDIEAVDSLQMTARLHMTGVLFRGSPVEGTINDCDSAVNHWRLSPDGFTDEDMIQMYGAYFGCCLNKKMGMVWQKEEELPRDYFRLLHPETKVCVFPFMLASEIVLSSHRSFGDLFYEVSIRISNARSAG